MADEFETYREGLDSPADNAAAVTPADGSDLAFSTRALYVGGAGDVAVNLTGDPATAITFVGVAAGSILPVRAVRVRATGTDATDIVALW